MKARHTRIALVGLACAAILGPGSTASAGTKPKPKPACQGALVTVGVQGADRYGLELFAWELCGRKGKGIPFG